MATKKKAARPSILDEIRLAIPKVRGSWLTDLPRETQKELEGVRAALKSGELNVSTLHLSEFLIAKFNLQTTTTAFRQWLAR